MTSTKLLYLVISCLISQSLQDLDNNRIEEEINPYKEAANDIRKEQSSQTLGKIMENILESDGDNLLGNILSEFGKQNAGQLLQGLGSVIANQNKKKDSDSPNVLDTLGSLMSNLQGDSAGKGAGAASLLQGFGSLLAQGGQGNQGAALLQGLGSLLGQSKEGKQQNQGAALLQGLSSLLNQGGNKNQGQDGTAAILQGLGSLMGQGGQEGRGIDPALIGTMLNMFTNQQGGEKEVKKESKKEDDEEFNMNDLLTLAGSFLGDQKEKKTEDVNFMTLMPSILQTINTFIGPDADNRAKNHEGHSWSMPPLLEKLHIFFDHFIHSELGKQTIAALGAEKSFKVFLDDTGRFSYKKFGELMENHSYRRQWISIVTDRIADYLQFVSEPKVYKSYLAGGQMFFNSYIKSQGFPKSTFFDPAKPVETISAFVNYIAKKYFEVKIHSKEYVKPAILYIQDVLKLAEKRGTIKSFSDSKELSSKLADTINLEIIEPLARVNRAYRFAKAVPNCERYVLCLVNENNQNEAESLPGLKKLLYKGASLVAGWFLSAGTGTPFWTLYTDITNNADCQKLYFDECNGFHVEELKVTTEYVHNEL